MNDRGVVLVIVLWIITILMTIGMSMSYLSRTELLSTQTHLRDTEYRYYALAGIEKAKIEITYQAIKSGQQDETIWRFDGTPYTIKIGNGMADVRIINESGKIDINTANEDILKNLLINYGIEEAQATSIVDAIMDWKDPDDIPRPKGAESDYYQSLPKPYKAKNAPFESVDELIHVKGITKEILYGSDNKKGIHQFLTVFSRTNVISIYHAPFEVLMAIPGVTEETAKLIIDRRKDFTPQNIHLLVQEIFGDSWAKISRYGAVYNTTFYTIFSEGYSKDTAKQRYGIKAVVSTVLSHKHDIVYYKEPTRFF